MVCCASMAWYPYLLGGRDCSRADSIHTTCHTKACRGTCRDDRQDQMKVFDPIYGKFEIPDVPGLIVDTPEFRRLSQIRLLNTISPTLATLGEIKRYSHTLGVIHLLLAWERTAVGVSMSDRYALRAAAVLHDMATPPFGHLFEYTLKERSGWNHESAIVDTLLGRHRSENIAHQFFAGQRLKALPRLLDADIDVQTVLKILSKTHNLSALILGSLDFDNIDNVFRMAWALGFSYPREVPIQLAQVLSVANDGRLCIPLANETLAAHWAEMRRRVYEVLVFDSSTVAAQAVLSKAIP